MCLGIIFINRRVEKDEGLIKNYLNKATEISAWLPKQQTRRAETRLEMTKFETNFSRASPRCALSRCRPRAQGPGAAGSAKGKERKRKEGKGRQRAKGRQGRGGHCPSPPWVPGPRAPRPAGDGCGPCRCPAMLWCGRVQLLRSPQRLGEGLRLSEAIPVRRGDFRAFRAGGAAEPDRGSPGAQGPCALRNPRFQPLRGTGDEQAARGHGEPCRDTGNPAETPNPPGHAFETWGRTVQGPAAGQGGGS